VVENPDPDKVTDFAEAAGDLDVLLGRRRITGYAKLGIKTIMLSSELCRVLAGVPCPGRVCEALDSA
jgi:hypothetical protein